jgi:hypothetical protein
MFASNSFWMIGVIDCLASGCMKISISGIDYRCDNKSFWLSAHNCQVPTPTSQNLELEQQIRVFGAGLLTNCLEDWNSQFLICRSVYQKKANSEKLGLGIDNPCRKVFFKFTDEQVLGEG